MKLKKLTDDDLWKLAYTALDYAYDQVLPVKVGLQLYGIKRGKNGKGMTWYVIAWYEGNVHCDDVGDLFKMLFDDEDVHVTHNKYGNTVLLIKESIIRYPDEIKQIKDRRTRVEKEFVYFGEQLEYSFYAKYGFSSVLDYYKIIADPGYQYQWEEIK